VSKARFGGLTQSLGISAVHCDEVGTSLPFSYDSDALVNIFAVGLKISYKQQTNLLLNLSWVIDAGSGLLMVRLHIAIDMQPVSKLVYKRALSRPHDCDKTRIRQKLFLSLSYLSLMSIVRTALAAFTLNDMHYANRCQNSFCQYLPPNNSGIVPRIDNARGTL